MSYFSASDFYKEIFGCKVYKVALDAGCTCPNRDGTKGSGGCIFCSANGSGDFLSSRSLSVSEQFLEAKELVASKNKSGKYLAYFQNFTNTYGNPDRLEKIYLEALSEENVLGVCIGTRPDCLEDDILKRIGRIAENHFVQIELGLQTIHEASAQYIRRGYETAVYEDAVRRIVEINPKIHIVTHLILGLPGETHSMMMDSVRYVSRFVELFPNVHFGLKLTCLYILKGTDLLKDYENGRVQALEEDEYFELLQKALTIIPQKMVVHRLTGDGPKSLLVAPMWTANKRHVHNRIMKELEQPI